MNSQKKSDDQPQRVVFPPNWDAKQILAEIRRMQDEWAKENPKRAHRLYPEIFDEHGNRIVG